MANSVAIKEMTEENLEAQIRLKLNTAGSTLEEARSHLMSVPEETLHGWMWGGINASIPRPRIDKESLCNIIIESRFEYDVITVGHGMSAATSLEPLPARVLREVKEVIGQVFFSLILLPEQKKILRGRNISESFLRALCGLWV